ncbi:MAG: LptF/LptG family permease [Aquificae bacterium]|nr:LptF/LptG family permease [Aquificota bacterium]
MLFSFLAWRITRGAYLTAFVLAFVLLMLQVFRIGFILFGLPITSSAPFFLTWFAYYTFFFLPDGIIVATALTAYELKEKKLLHVLYSFHISPRRLLLMFSIPVLLFFILSAVLSPFMFEEQVSFARRGLFIQYKDRIFENIPEKTFLSSGGIVIYAGDKKKGEIREVFLKYKNTYILAESAYYEGKGRFLFERGSLLTKERGKYFLMEFDKYWLDTEEFLATGIREKRAREGKILNAVNTLSIIPMFLFSFFGALKLCRTHTQVYYLIGAGILLHQLLLFMVKVIL